MSLRALAADLTALLLPRGCLGCGGHIPPEGSQGLVCDRCRIRLRPLPPPFGSRCHFPQGTGHARSEVCLECIEWPAALRTVRCAVVLDRTSGSLVHALKYRGWRDLASLMARKMAPFVPEGLKAPLLVPLPTTEWRRRIRGYNQAMVLAEALARETGLGVEEALFRASGGTQVRLGPRQRRVNVRNVFSLVERHRSRISDRDVILIDDVLTTGATGVSAARTLAEAQVSSVSLVTFARALPYSGG